MKILWLTHRAETPSTRYRVAAFVPRFKSAGHDVEVVEYTSSLLKIYPLMKSVASADVVVIQKRLPPPWITRAIRRRAKRLIFDFDDAIYLKKGDQGTSRTGARQKRFKTMMQSADVVICGNSHLATIAKEEGGRQLEVVPTVLDPGKYLAAPRQAHDEVVLGWIGAGGNMKYLEELLPHLPKTRIRCVCNVFPAGVEKIEWSEAGEAAALAGMDIGLAPMPDNEWTRGKCGTRILQYFAAALPVIADGVGVHRDLVEDGKSGYLVHSRKEWTARVTELVADPVKRAQFGKRGQGSMVAQYSLDAVAPQLIQLITKPS